MRTAILMASACLIIPLCGGCETPVRPGAVYFFEAPAVQAVRSPDMESGTYQKFTTIPSVKEGTDSGMHPLVEKQLLYMVRNELESLGYRFAESKEESDFFVTLTYSNEHRRGQVEESHRTGVYNVGGSMGLAESRGIANTPGSFCPTFAVRAVDTRTDKEIWSGSVLAETPNPEIRLSANHLLPALTGQRFPLAPQAAQTVDAKEGIFGCLIKILTPAGNDYFPVVTGLLVSSPALNKLQAYDIITEIDGRATRNKPYSEIRAAFDKDPGEKVSLTLNRNGKTLKTTLTATEEARIRWLDLLTVDYATGRSQSVPLAAQSSGVSKETVVNLLP